MVRDAMRNIGNIVGASDIECWLPALSMCACPPRLHSRPAAGWSLVLAASIVQISVVMIAQRKICVYDVQHQMPTARVCLACVCLAACTTRVV